MYYMSQTMSQTEAYHMSQTRRYITCHRLVTDITCPRLGGILHVTDYVTD